MALKRSSLRASAQTGDADPWVYFVSPADQSLAARSCEPTTHMPKIDLDVEALTTWAV